MPLCSVKVPLKMAALIPTTAHPSDQFTLVRVSTRPSFVNIFFFLYKLLKSQISGQVDLRCHNHAAVTVVFDGLRTRYDFCRPDIARRPNKLGDFV